MDSQPQIDITSHERDDPSGSVAARVLIADDNPDIRLLLRLVLEGAGLTITGEATGGLETLRLWRSSLTGPLAPDVVVLDNQMPDMTGLEVAAYILAERPSQIIVLCSAFLDSGIQTWADETGITSCVAKTNIRLLPAVVKELINTARVRH